MCCLSRPREELARDCRIKGRKLGFLEDSREINFLLLRTIEVVYLTCL